MLHVPIVCSFCHLSVHTVSLDFPGPSFPPLVVTNRAPAPGRENCGPSQLLVTKPSKIRTKKCSLFLHSSRKANVNCP